MGAPSVDVKDILVAASIGTFAGTSGWGIYISREPESPDSTVTIYDVGGLTPNPKFLLEEPSVQIRVRGNPDGYVAAYNKSYAIQNALLGLTPQTINTTNYRGVLAIGGVAFIAYDEQRRPIFTQNYRLVAEPASGTYRVSL